MMTVTITDDTYYNWLDAVYDRLEFTPDGDSWKWRCGDVETQDRLGLARAVATALGLDFDVLLAEARRYGHACCDCELIFNCDPRPDEDDD